MTGILRSGGKFTYRPALWWYDADLGAPTVSFQMYLDNVAVLGAPVTDPGTATWAAFLDNTMRGKALKTRETLTAGGAPVFVETDPVTISILPGYENVDTFPNTPQTSFATGYASDSGIPWTRLGDLDPMIGL